MTTALIYLIVFLAGMLFAEWLHRAELDNHELVLSTLHEERIRQLNVAHAHALMDQFEMGRRFGRTEVGA